MAAQTPDHRITINHSETLQSSPNSLQPPRSISRSRGASHLAVHLCFSCRFPVAFWISPDVFLVTSAEKIHLDKVVFTVFFFFSLPSSEHLQFPGWQKRCLLVGGQRTHCFWMEVPIHANTQSHLEMCDFQRETELLQIFMYLQENAFLYARCEALMKNRSPSFNMWSQRTRDDVREFLASSQSMTFFPRASPKLHENA